MGRSRFRSTRKLDPSLHRTLDALANQNRTNHRSYSQPYTQAETHGDTSGQEEQPALGASTSIPPPSYARSRSRRGIAPTEEACVQESRGWLHEHQYKHRNHHRSSSPTHAKSKEARSRSSSRSRSWSVHRRDTRGNRRWRPPQRNNSLVMTPSRYWISLSVRMRLVFLLGGFVIIYYGVFAKHHYFDREASSIRDDVRDLIKQANKTGFMQQLFIDGKVPDIFLEDENPVKKEPPSSPTKIENVSEPEPEPEKEKRDGKEMRLGETDIIPKTGSGGEEDDFKRKGHKKTFGRRKKRKSDVKNEPDPEEVGEDENGEDGQKQDKRPISEIIERASDADFGAKPDDPETAEKKKAELEKSFPMGGHPPRDDGFPMGGDANATQPQNSSTESAKTTSTQPTSDDSSSEPSNTSAKSGSEHGSDRKEQVSSTESSGATSSSTESSKSASSKSGSSGEEANKKNSPENTSEESKSKNEEAVSKKATKQSEDKTKTEETKTSRDGKGESAKKEDNQKAQESGPEVATEKVGDKDKTKEERTAQTPANITAVEGFLMDGADYANDFRDLNPEEIGKDHLPLLNWHYESIANPEVTQQIFGVGNKLDHVVLYKPLCVDTTKESAVTFEGQTICSGFNRTFGWFLQYCSVMQTTSRKEALLKIEEERKTEAWLTENAAHIHWIEGLTILQVLEKNCGNIAHFAGRILLLQHILENIMAYSVPPRNPLNVLILPTFHIMKRFLYPHNYEFWHKYVFQSLVAPHQYGIGTMGNFLYRESKPRPENQPLFHLLHNFSLDATDHKTKYVCFRRAIVPAYLKARFFVDDKEFPSTKPSLQSAIPGAPSVPRDSLRLRERVNALIGQKADFEMRSKEIMLLDRTGQRRVFSKDGRKKILDMMTRVSKEKGYTFTVTSFDKMPFNKQYDVMKNVAIAVGIHGANLVNTMFMPPLSVLLEIFPYGFQHEMYVNGGNAGLKYHSYMMKGGTPFEGPRVYRSVAQCIKINPKCKVHYRDAMLQPKDEDLGEIERILRESIDWCDALPSGPTKQQKRRRTRRRRTRRQGA